MNADRIKEYWRKNVTLIIILLIIWAAVSLLAGVILAETLFNVKVGQLPMSFWFAQQGAEITFVILIFFYSWRMDKMDKEYDVVEEKLSKTTDVGKGVQG